MPDDLPLYRLSLEKYHQLAEAGILSSEDNVELIHGYLIAKEKKTPLHCLGNDLTDDELRKRVPDGFFVSNKGAITLTDSEPEPDVSVVRGRLRDYLKHHPYATDTCLVVEASETHLAFDRTTKKRLYAAERIPVYWIVNLIDHVLEVHTDPHGNGDQADYATIQRFGPADQVPLTIAGQALGTIPVRDLLP